MTPLADRSFRILRLCGVEAMTGLKRSAIYDGQARGTFPKSIKLSARSVGWLESDVVAWIAARIAESRPAVATEAKP